MKLIDNWRKAHKFWSVRLAVIAALLGTVEQMLPYLGDFLPPQWFSILNIVVMLAAVVARLVAQPKAHADE
jgi:protein-S-isoprenylcysteine O-methyltransferase Ste14